MNGKKVNLAFLISIILYIGCSFGLSYLAPRLSENLVVANGIVELVVVLPGLLFVIFAKEDLPCFLGFHKIRISTLLLIIPFTMLTMPFVTLLNLLTQFFTENAAASMVESYKIAEMPFLLVLFVIGIFAPFCEELACRGVFYRGYRKSGTAFGAMLLSALLFGIMHMNMNQAVYAFAIGILAVLLVEATGSLWSSVVYHGLINSSQVVIMYLTLKIDPDTYSEAAQLVTTNMLVYSVAVYLVIAALTLPVAWALLVWMGEREGRSGVLASVWRDRKRSGVLNENKKDKLITIPLVIALILCVAMMALPVILAHMMK